MLEKELLDPVYNSDQMEQATVYESTYFALLSSSKTIESARERSGFMA